MIITCPNCYFSRNINQDKIHGSARLATCPKCNFRFEFKTDNPNTEEQEKKITCPVPWEDSENFSRLKGFFHTVLRVLLTPSKFFALMPQLPKSLKPFDGLRSRALLYAVTFYFLVNIFQTILGYYFTYNILLNVINEKSLNLTLPTLHITQLLLILPLTISLRLVFLASAFTVVLRLFAVQTATIAQTGRIICYSSSALFLSIIPIIGPFLGDLFSLYVLYLGFRQIYKISIVTGLSTIILVYLLLLSFEIFLTINAM